MMRWPSFMMTIAIVMVGYITLSMGTDGWSIWTAEGARRQAVLDRPSQLPDFPLQDSKGQPVVLTGDNKSLIVLDLIFTQCPTLCLAMGAQFQQLQNELQAGGLLHQVELLSITFDPNNDDNQALQEYLARFGAIEPNWRTARFENNEDLVTILDDLGVIVIQEPLVGFVHNAAFYLIEDGYVVEIFDVDDRTDLLAAIHRRKTS